MKSQPTKFPKYRGRPRYDDVLTPAEWRVVNAVRHGLSNGQIARLRGISLDAVKFHTANAIAKLELENRQALRQWRGIQKLSALRNRGVTMNNTPNIISVGQIARSVRDVKLAEDWYRNILGLPHLYTFGKLAFFDCGGTRLFLSEEADKPKDESILYFKVADIQVSYDLLQSRAVEFIGAPHMIHKHEDGTEEWMAFFKDLDGRPLALMSQVAQPKS